MKANFVNFILCFCDFSLNFSSKFRVHFLGISNDISLKQRPQFRQIFVTEAKICNRQRKFVCNTWNIGSYRVRNMRSKICTDWNNSRPENVVKYRCTFFGMIFRRKAPKSKEIRWNLFALLLHNTVVYEAGVNTLQIVELVLINMMKALKLW